MSERIKVDYNGTALSLGGWNHQNDFFQTGILSKSNSDTPKRRSKYICSSTSLRRFVSCKHLCTRFLCRLLHLKVGHCVFLCGLLGTGKNGIGNENPSAPPPCSHSSCTQTVCHHRELLKQKTELQISGERLWPLLSKLCILVK